MDDSTQNFTEAWHKSLAAKRLEYMKKESYYATLRRDVEKTIVLSHIHGNPCYDANSVSGLGLIQDGYGTFQIPTECKTVRSSTIMTIGVSLGVPPDYYIIPDVVNLSVKRARDKILKSGLRVGNIAYEYQPDLLPNTVIEQNMTVGMRVSFPTSINLLVSTINKD